MFKTNNKMPITNVLLLFSYISAVLAVLGAGYLLIFKPNLKSLVLGIIVLFGGMLLAAVVRMFANIGQILFDFKNLIFNDLQSVREDLQSLNRSVREDLQSLNRSVREDLQSLNRSVKENLQSLKDNLEQVNCDSKDINQNISQIKTFFEQIERHLDLKK